MHDHEYTITLLKTPYGYLTKNGFTDNINFEDIILLPSNSYGKWASFEEKIKYFCKYSNISEDDLNSILKNQSKCEIYTFLCRYGTQCCYFNNTECKNSYCEFWNDDRSKLKLSRLY